MSSGLPEGWENKRIGELGEIVTGFTPSTTEADFWNGDIPFVSPADFTKDVYVKTTAKKVTELGASKGRMLPPNTILVTCIGSLGDIALTSKNCITNQQINSIIVNKENDAQFIFYNMQLHSGELKKLAGTTTIPIINKSTFSSIDLPIPPLPEQEKIAAVLGAVDDVIEKTALQIKKLNDLKISTMNELLTKGIGHTDFKPSELGQIPKSWEVATLSEIAIEKGIQTGPFGSQLHSHEYVETGIPVIMPQDMASNSVITNKIAKITESRAEDLKKHKVKFGDILFSRRGDVGRFALISEKNVGWICGTGCFKVRLNQKKVTPNFVACVISMRYAIEWLKNNAVGQTMPNLNTEILSNLPLFLPPLPEQKQIASILDSISTQIEKVENKLASLNALKKSLMQDLLSGKVRVRVRVRV